MQKLKLRINWSIKQRLDKVKDIQMFVIKCEEKEMNLLRVWICARE